MTHNYSITFVKQHVTRGLITSLGRSLASFIPLIQPMYDCLTYSIHLLNNVLQGALERVWVKAWPALYH